MAVYLVVGAVVFSVLEGDWEKDIREDLRNTRAAFLQAHDTCMNGEWVDRDAISCADCKDEYTHYTVVNFIILTAV